MNELFFEEGSNKEPLRIPDVISGKTEVAHSVKVSERREESAPIPPSLPENDSVIPEKLEKSPSGSYSSERSSPQSGRRSASSKLPASGGKRASLTSIEEISADETVYSNRRSSLEMRKMPVNVMLNPPNFQDTSSGLSDDTEEKVARDEDDAKYADFLRLLCLRPRFTLQKQMMLSFGSINLITIMSVVLVCVALSISAGKNVKSASSHTMKMLATQSLGYRSRFLAESLTESFILLEVVRFLYEATQDRFEGHPTMSDEFVPFFDLDSESNAYPVTGPDMRIEWDVSPNVNESNYHEFLQGRWKVYRDTPIDSRQAGFFIQGACNPLEENPLASAYWPNCSEANNDVFTGGVVSPSNETELYYRKGGDMVLIFRALFEQWDVIRDLGLYFMNKGAGATVNYPHYATSTQSTYVSIGCDWLLSPNPYLPSRTIGTEDMIRNCRSEGEEVSTRLYNPMERGFCRDQALQPEKIFASVFESATNAGEWLLVLGRGIYDRMTSEFIGCMYVGIDLEKINEFLVNSKTTEKAEATVVHYEENGYIVASSKDLTGEGRLSIFDADLGFSDESYRDLFLLVDFNHVWDPSETRKSYESFTTSNNDFFVSVHPMPPVPDEYDPEYRPIFFVVTSFHADDLYESIEALDDNVDRRVQEIITFAWISGLVGFAVATAIIFAMARILTSPLTNMNNVANEIVCSFGNSKKEDEIRRTGDVSLDMGCSPRTELVEVVGEFNKMVANFSGSAEAKSEKFKDDDMENSFPARRDLLPLYDSRSDKMFKYNATGERVESERDDGFDVHDTSIAYLHFGSKLGTAATPSTRHPLNDAKLGLGTKSKRCTALFAWIVLLIATPLLFITILVSAGVVSTVNAQFAKSTQDLQEEYLFLEKQVMLSFARVRAEFVSRYTQKFLNDLYMMTRFTSWLLAGGINTSGSFTAMASGVEECKNYSQDFSKCPYVQEKFVCDCAWKEIGYEDECTVFPNASSSRHLQKNYWISEVSSATDGVRMTTTFPQEFFSPESGAWWDNITSVPGSETWDASSRHKTTYDRLRVFSAVPVGQPLSNYRRGTGVESTLGLGVGFEEDGTFIGFDGCDSTLHVSLSAWSSTEENGAADIRPELCPLGKHGYDPRCRGWYDTGRRRFLEDNVSLHITPPYRFALREATSDAKYAQTATMPIYDPITSVYVGQTFIDFVSTPIHRALEHGSYLGAEGFPVLITVYDKEVQDTIIGPGVSAGQDSQLLLKSVLPYDERCIHDEGCPERVNQFKEIIDSMKNGESSERSFERKKGNGHLETLHIAYSPVDIISVEPINSSDYSRGVTRVPQLVYSLALVKTELEMLLPFREIESTTKHQTDVAIGILVVVIFLATLLIIYISHRLATSFSDPMMYLLRLLRHINTLGAGEDPPTVRKMNASHEIVAFSETLEALFRIVRSANTAFFNGDLEFAYQVLNDALRLFRRLDNSKAIGIASNNLGNILLAIYREMNASHVDSLYGFSRDNVVLEGIAHFHKAIRLGEKAYDEFYEMQGWSPSCLDFMQHLSNRYFNRGLFLLHVKKDHNNSNEVEQLGMRDIQIAGDMDREVVEYGEEIGWGSDDRAEKRFNVNIVRIRGFNILYELGYTKDWGMEELIDETVDIVRKEFANIDSDFFTNMSLAGRLQELEIQLMRYHSLRGNLALAAKIAVRMIIEDERVFTEAISEATKVLINYAENEADADFRTKMVPVLLSYQKTITKDITKKRQSVLDDMVSLSASLTKSMVSSIRNRSFRESRLSIHGGDESSRIVTMEDF